MSEPDGSRAPLCYEHIPLHDVDLAPPLPFEEILEEPARLAWRRVIPLHWFERPKA